jgi:predicted phosphodiesterase
MNYLGYELFARSFGSVDPRYESERVYLQGVASFQYDSTTGVVGRTGRARLFEGLEEVEQEITGVFLHHNLVPVPHSRNKALLEDAGDFLRELVDSEVDIALTGTSSHPHAVQVGSTVISNAGSVSSIYQRSAYGNSFNLVDVYEKAIAVSEISSMWGSRRLLGMWERRSVR